MTVSAMHSNAMQYHATMGYNVVYRQTMSVLPEREGGGGNGSRYNGRGGGWIEAGNQACPPMTRPQLVSSGPSTLPPSPLNHATIS